MNHPRELSTPSRCPECGGTSWTKSPVYSDSTRQRFLRDDWLCNGCNKWLLDLALIDAVKNPRPSGYMRDPSMQAASDEITAILRKYDLMAVVLMSGQERSGWNIELSPSWSCVRPGEPAADGSMRIRIKSKREDYTSTEDQQKHIAATIGGIMGILSNTRFINESLSGMMSAISHKIEIQHVQHDPTVKRMGIDLEE